MGCAASLVFCFPSCNSFLLKHCICICLEQAQWSPYTNHPAGMRLGGTHCRQYPAGSHGGAGRHAGSLMRCQGDRSIWPLLCCVKACPGTTTGVGQWKSRGFGQIFGLAGHKTVSSLGFSCYSLWSEAGCSSQTAASGQYEDTETNDSRAQAP